MNEDKKHDLDLVNHQQIKSFTFFRSYFEAANELSDETAKALFLLGICQYAFTGIVPNFKSYLAAMFQLVKPNIDSSMKKSASGALGGRCKRKPEAEYTQSKTEANEKQTGSKEEANEKQTGSDKDKGQEVDKDNGAGNIGNSTDVDKEFKAFWDAYPRKQGYAKALQEYKKALESGVSPKILIETLSKQAESNEWKKEDGRYIPNPAKWLSEERWKDEFGGNNSEGRCGKSYSKFDDPFFERLYEYEKEGRHAACKMSNG